MKQFSCGDVVPGCRRTFREADDAAIMSAVAAHARDDHGLVEIPAELADQVRARISVA
jgi:predicted small metal-binding protein